MYMFKQLIFFIMVIYHASSQSAYTFLCVLYCVATHPDIQVRLREEITSVVGDSVNVTPEHIHRLTLLKNCIKESQRLEMILSSFDSWGLKLAFLSYTYIKKAYACGWD
jgi:cytochrome P450